MAKKTRTATPSQAPRIEKEEKAEKAEKKAKAPKEPKEPKETVQGKLHVSNVADGTTEKDVRKVFTEYGALKSIVVVKKSGTKIRCVFVTYEDDDAAGKALEAVNGRDFKGQELKVQRAVPYTEDPNKEIYISGLSKEAKEDAVRKEFEKCGEIRKWRWVVNRGKFAGRVLLRYAAIESMHKALKKDGKAYGDSTLTVKTAFSAQQKHEDKAEAALANDAKRKLKLKEKKAAHKEKKKKAIEAKKAAEAEAEATKKRKAEAQEDEDDDDDEEDEDEQPKKKQKKAAAPVEEESEDAEDEEEEDAAPPPPKKVAEGKKKKKGSK